MPIKNDTRTELKKGLSQFTLVGAAKVNDYTFKIDTESASGWISNQLNLGVDCGDGALPPFFGPASMLVMAENRRGYFLSAYVPLTQFSELGQGRLVRLLYP